MIAWAAGLLQEDLPEQEEEAALSDALIAWAPVAGQVLAELSAILAAVALSGQQPAAS